jgi:hypothetical protein
LVYALGRSVADYGLVTKGVTLSKKSNNWVQATPGYASCLLLNRQPGVA